MELHVHEAAHLPFSFLRCQWKTLQPSLPFPMTHDLTAAAAVFQKPLALTCTPTPHSFLSPAQAHLAVGVGATLPRSRCCTAAASCCCAPELLRPCRP